MSAPPHDSTPAVPPVRVDPTGRDGPTARESRGRGWRRSRRGLFVPADLERSASQRVLDAAAYQPDGVAVTGWSALHWYGARWFDGLDRSGRAERPVVLASAVTRIRSQAGFQVCYERLDPAEVVEHLGISVVVPARAVFFEMRYAANLWDAVVALDMAAYDDLVSIGEVAEYALAHPGWTGVPQARAALMLADENSWSPWETRARLVATQIAELGPLLCNRPVFDFKGQLLGTPDLLEPDAGLAIEYDGGVHLADGQRGRDISREHRFRAHGLELDSIVGGHFAYPEVLARRLRESRDRAAGLGLERRWTLAEPPWWRSSYTVQLRRALTGRAKEAVDRRRRDFRP